MVLTAPPIDHESVPATRLPESGPTRRRLVVEVGVFLALLVPRLALSFFSTGEGGAPFVLTSVATIVTDLGLVGLVWFFLWTNHEPGRAIGLTERSLWRELGLGLLLAGPIWLATNVAEHLFIGIGWAAPKPGSLFTLSGHDPLMVALACLTVLVVGFTEELVFRGYLIERLHVVTRSAFWAVLLASGVFMLGHGYEGPAAMTAIGVFGLLEALLYWWRRSITAPVVVHVAFDLVAIVLIPLGVLH